LRRAWRSRPDAAAAPGSDAIGLLATET